VQVIQGQVSDRAAVRERLDVWMSELARAPKVGSGVHRE
jgi:hypothetical protein